MLKIYLTRHGQDQDNASGLLNGHRDTPLTARGVEQANELADKIFAAGFVFDNIYSSPLQRAKRTAEIIAQKLNFKPVEILPDLIERDFGILAGKPIKDIEVLCYPEIIKSGPVSYFLSAQGADTFPALMLRAKKVLDALTQKYQHGNILLVSHGDFGKMLYAAFYQLDWQRVLAMFHFGNSELILLSPDSDPEDVYIFRTKQFNP